MPEWSYLDRDGTRLAVASFGGRGPPVVLLHGLAGHAEEWTKTAKWLRGRHRVFALDVRGHGRSERVPDDVSPRVLVDDVVAVIERIREPVVLVGHSVSGITALLVASERPQLVRVLVVVEASPEGMGDELAARHAAEMGEVLAAWPVPFSSGEEARRFFGGPSVAATAWVEGLEAHEGGLRPRFEIDVVVKMLREAVSPSYWSAWEEIRSPTLIVRAGEGSLKAETAREMVERLSVARLVEVDGAKHDVHLDRPDEWREVLSAVLRELG